MTISIKGAREHNLRSIDAEIGAGFTVVTGVSGSGKSSLVFDTLYHEARRRLLDVYSTGSVAGKLAPADVAFIGGLGPAVAVGQNLLNRNPNSTLATASGLHPFLRLLYARFGERACHRCGARLHLLTEDDIIARLSSLSAKRTMSVFAPIVHGVRGSHRTLLELLSSAFGEQSLLVDGRTFSRADIYLGQDAGLDPQRPHQVEVKVAKFDSAITPSAAREIVEKSRALGSQALTVRSAEMERTWAWSPICLRCGSWFGSLEPVHFHTRCPHCAGEGCEHCLETGLYPEAASVYWDGLNLPSLLSLSVKEMEERFSKASLPESAERLEEELHRRLTALKRVGLGYLALDRSSPTLSRGEAQRVRLALILTSRLEDMLHVLDEPTIGQHPADISNLLEAMRELSGPVVFVEHDRLAAAEADTALDLGPGAGKQGGRVVFQGKPSDLWKADTATGHYFSGRSKVLVPAHRPPPKKWLAVRGADKHNLAQIDVSMPLKRLTAVTGVSGSGKSTLVVEVIAASLNGKEAIGCAAIEGPTMKAVVVDQKPIGRNPRSNPATYTKLSDVIRDHFAEISGLTPSHFSFNRPEGACENCKGMGAIEVRMRYLPSTFIPCSQCQGRRFSEEITSTRIPFNDRQLSIDELYGLPISEVRRLFAGSKAMTHKASRIMDALCEIGLGYLPLGQPSPSLSGGEAQRVKLAKYLGRSNLSGRLLILDEPTTGLHPQDIDGLLSVLDRLVRSGATLLMVEHNLDAIRAADWIIDLGPGAGPDGGRLLYQGSLEGLSQNKDSATALALVSDTKPIRPRSAPEKTPQSLKAVSIRGARVNNLKDVAVEIPKTSITVFTGISGSGKSSLVTDVLETEARRRYLESLSLYERQGIKEGPEASVEAIAGLGVAIAVSPERRLREPRATVGTATEIASNLSVMLTWVGEATCSECGKQLADRELTGSGVKFHCQNCQHTLWVEPRLFSPTTYAAACKRCSGIGSLQLPNPEKLIRYPDRPLCDGAMYSPGFFPKGYLCKPFNMGYDMVRALGDRYGFDPASTPWVEMTEAARQAFLFGDPDPLEVHFQTRSRSDIKKVTFPGFYGFVRDWDIGGTYTDRIVCPACNGARLRPQYLDVRLIGHNIHDLGQMSLDRLQILLDKTAMHQMIGELGEEDHQVVAASYQTTRKRLHFLNRVGLGYLHLEQGTSTLSAGEAQRIRLAGLMGSELASLIVLLDEPTRGMHPVEVGALMEALVEMCEEGNTVIMVEHDEQAIRGADYLVDMGPGAGADGGNIVASGPMPEVLEEVTLTTRWLRGERTFDLVRKRREPGHWLTIREPLANNLKGEDIGLPTDVLVGVCGVSGSGKSTLIMDILGRVLAPKKHTTSVASEQIDPGRHRAIEGAPQKTIIVDQSRAGVVSPASFLGLERPLVTLFAESDAAAALGLSEKELRRGCSACNGRGASKIDMGFLPAVYSTCEVCRGTGYRAEAWEVQLRDLALPEVFHLTIDELYHRFGDIDSLRPSLNAARSVGVGYLVLRQPGRALSGGEAQRLKIAAELKKRANSPRLYLLDEPTVGQHLEDVLRLNEVFQSLVDAEHGVVVIEHHPHLLAGCDWLVELGPGGGPDGGRVIAQGTPEEIAAGDTPTAPFMREVLGWELEK